jgi:RNA polymerase sigma-70 factor (ECF subfamily)
MTNFEQIYNDNKRAISIYISKTVKDKMLVEDLTSDVFLKAVERFNQFDESKSNLSTWLHTIAKNVIIDYFRTAHVDKYISVSQFATEDNEDGDKIFNFADTSVNDNQVERNELHCAIRKAVKGLKPKYRVIAKFHFIQQMSYKEIGTLLEMPEGSVKGMIFRVRDMLRTSLAEYVNS